MSGVGANRWNRLWGLQSTNQVDRCLDRLIDYSISRNSLSPDLALETSRPPDRENTGQAWLRWVIFTLQLVVVGILPI